METDIERRYVYFISVHFDLDGRMGFSTRKTYNGETFTPTLLTTSEAVVAAGDQFMDDIAQLNPTWDCVHSGWRDTVFVMGCSLLRVEERRDGEWMPKDCPHQNLEDIDAAQADS